MPAANKTFEGLVVPTDTKVFEVPPVQAVMSLDDFCLALGGVSRQTVENMIERKEPNFPRKLRVGSFRAAFYVHEVAFYLKNLPRAADAPVHHGGKVHLHKKQKSATRAA